MTGIIPKMAIRFTSYEWYKQLLADKDGAVTNKATFSGMSSMEPSVWLDDSSLGMGELYRSSRFPSLLSTLLLEICFETRVLTIHSWPRSWSNRSRRSRHP